MQVLLNKINEKLISMSTGSLVVLSCIALPFSLLIGGTINAFLVTYASIQVMLIIIGSIIAFPFVVLMISKCSRILSQKARKQASQFPNHLIVNELGSFYTYEAKISLLDSLNIFRFIAMKQYFSTLTDFTHQTITKEPFAYNLVASIVSISEPVSSTVSLFGNRKTFEEQKYSALYFSMDEILNKHAENSDVNGNLDHDFNSRQGYKLLTRIIKLYEKNGYTIYDYAELLNQIYNHFDEYYRNHSKIESSENSMRSVKEYYKGLKKHSETDVDSSDYAFMKIPIEWQWDSIVGVK